ncbi:MAG: polyphosphate kinase 1 [Phycisphaerae bacterium]
MAETIDLNAPELYINRELSWLEFNDRVLREGLNADLPLLERLKFLAIVSSNLDEFFMIRVAGLKQQKAANIRKRDISGLTPAQQIKAISRRTHKMVAEQDAGIAEVIAALQGENVRLIRSAEMTDEQRSFVRGYFLGEVLPVLTPLAVDRLEPMPRLPALTLMLAVRLQPHRPGQDEEERAKADAPSPRIAVVPVPGVLPRFVGLPAEEGLVLIGMEELVAEHLGRIFPGDSVEAWAQFRLTRDADVEVGDDAGDLLGTVEEAIRSRKRRGPVRLEISAEPDAQILDWLVQAAELGDDDVYQIRSVLDASALMDIAFRPGLERLRDPGWPPQPVADLVGCDDIWQLLQEKDILLSHPYETFDPVVQLLDNAAEDPNVLAIKQTLYRTSGDSPIIGALERAAHKGKQVIVLVELKARFDEERNIQWARRLEDAGCLVIYGIAGYKTHAKALLIIRRESQRISRYVHMSTGNYNDKTAKLYSDLGLMTADKDVAADVAAFFNLLTGYSETVDWAKISIAPTGLRDRIVELIDREIQASTPDEPGLIMAKFNSLHDKGIAQALYRASQAGIRVRLNVRGICCIRPGVQGVSENIEVVSIVDRFLEHARIFYFHNGGHEELYMSSADWMTRNLDKRLELLFPVTQANLKRRLVHYLETYFADNVKARRLLQDGSYERVRTAGPSLRAQETFYEETVENVEQAERGPTRFKPLKNPEKGR